ncbi:MAG: hypothetical protein JNJ57_17155 [Saprospiraceae bacterium]|nr:hypothetical protein [Saprospiraceae bacterium]
MKRFLIKGIIGGVVLLLFSYLAIYLVVALAPSLAEQYYDPVFSFEGEKGMLYFAHPFILSFALAWFWRRFKGLFHGSFWWRGFEVGVVYGLIATVPAMWITYCSLAISLGMVVTWVLYGFFQAIVLGILYAKISP